MNKVETGSATENASSLMGGARLALLLAAMAIGVSGCSGGSGGSTAGGTASGGTTPPPVTQPSGRGTVVVSVKDVLGAPVPGADVRINTYWGNEDKRAVADANGRAEFKDVIASDVSVTVFGPASYAETPNRRLESDSVMAVEVTAQPTADATGGIAAAWVPAGGVSGDGRTLEFSLQILQVPNADGEYWAWGTDAVRVLACTPDAADDLPRFRPDCVSGADGFDGAYEGVNHGRAVSVKRVESPSGFFPPSTYSAALLLDQSAHIIVDDPADARLFAAKYLLSFTGSSDNVLLSAFASDDAVSGQLGLLPQKPVSRFPLENPQYTHDGRSLFSTVDSLASLEGGASPLFAAIDRTLDFAAAHRGTGQNNAVVVVTDGRDETCGSRADCQKARDAVIQKSRATGVAIVTVGLAGAAGNADHETLGLLAQGAHHGAAFWAQDPKQLATIAHSVPWYLMDNKDLLEATFRVQSPVAGAFASGRSVLGTVQLEVCPFDCFYTLVPFVVQIP